MSEEKKEPIDQTPEQEAEQTLPPETEETSQDAPGKNEKPRKEPKKKEKTYTLTREQMEAAELAARQLASVTDQFTRLSAEYDNYRKRTAKEKESIYQDAKADTVTAFLAVYDNLERAMQAGGDDESPHKKGLEMIFTQYKEVLLKLGVTEMEALGQPFDPNRHNAVMHIDDETLGENVVADVFQAGFMMGDKVLRFAAVRVAN
ncbi:MULTISPECIES: nucleotide exchange factor GrpE [unclassified Oscillibacter]|uniref:nucleotide exchange factor GrpE n=1 Tax=unclassified Oscillibacter TaxID=2629304 RepID=UPI0025E3FE7F|nr:MULTISPECIES: nucleotide exchange factor GrpE [unclassified Oscillibacter]